MCVLFNFLWRRRTLALQQPYSPELAPSDFNLFGSLKDAIPGKRLESYEEVTATSKFQLSECDREASTMRWSWSIRSCCAMDIYIKVKWCHYRPGVSQKVGRGIALLFHDHGIRRGWVVSITPRPHFTRYPFYRRLCGPQGRSGRAENLVPTGIRSRTVQPVAQSLYRLSYRAHIYITN